MYALIVWGCTAPLLPGERVIGWDAPATFFYGGAASQLGASVAADEDGWVATAPGDGSRWADGVSTAEPARFVALWGAIPVWTNGGTVESESGETWTLDNNIVAIAASTDGVVVATSTAVLGLTGGWRVEQKGVTALAMGGARVLVMGDGVTALTFEGEALGRLGEGRGGGLGEWGGFAWWGTPEWDDDEAAGRASCEDGREIEGLPGDHLGGTIGGGYTAGTFNRLLTPQRARLVPLDGGDVLALEAGAERQPLGLSGSGGDLVLGAPYQPHAGENAGAVVVVSP